jgi:hypothetical protein
MECDYCHKEFIKHRSLTVLAMYCSPEHSRRGGEKTIQSAVENRQKWRRIRYGVPRKIA